MCVSRLGAAFPVETANNLVATKERLRALPVHLRAMVTKVVRQGGCHDAGCYPGLDWRSGECLSGEVGFPARIEGQ